MFVHPCIFHTAFSKTGHCRLTIRYMNARELYDSRSFVRSLSIRGHQEAKQAWLLRSLKFRRLIGKSPLETNVPVAACGSCLMSPVRCSLCHISAQCW